MASKPSVDDSGQCDKTLVHFADWWHWFSEPLLKEHLDAQRDVFAAEAAKEVYSAREDSPVRKQRAA